MGAMGRARWQKAHLLIHAGLDLSLGLVGSQGPSCAPSPQLQLLKRAKVDVRLPRGIPNLGVMESWEAAVPIVPGGGGCGRL